MQTQDATQAMELRTLVEAGSGDDYDCGYIIAIDKHMATVAWKSGVRTPCPLCDLRHGFCGND